MMTEPNPTTLFTIGHSNHPISHFLGLLGRHGIGLLADIRSVPASRHHPQFGKRRLRDSLAAQGIAYAFLGQQLGGRPRDPACLVDGVVSYERVAETAAFQEGLTRLVCLAQAQPVAMMCAERNPADCHRSRLVSPALIRHGWEVRHILADGTVQEHGRLETPSQSDLFAPSRSA